MAVAEVSVVPVGTGKASISEFVVRAVELVKASGLKYELSSMGTNIEGEVSEILEVARRVHEACFEMGAVRVLTTLKIDDRRDKPLSIEGKKKSVESKIK
ncbi:MAG: MTH1187 family thiamine-binding protein [bacterium]